MEFLNVFLGSLMSFGFVGLAYFFIQAYNWYNEYKKMCLVKEKCQQFFKILLFATASLGYAQVYDLLNCMRYRLDNLSNKTSKRDSDMDSLEELLRDLCTQVEKICQNKNNKNNQEFNIENNSMIHNGLGI